MTKKLLKVFKILEIPSRIFFAPCMLTKLSALCGKYASGFRKSNPLSTPLQFFGAISSKHIVFYVFILAFILRVINIDYDLYFDESASWGISRNSSVIDIIKGKYSDETNTPLFYLFLKPWTNIFVSEFALRLFSIFFSIIGLIYIYKLFSQTLSAKYTLLGLLIFSILPLYLHYSRVLRFYSVGFTFQTISLYYFLKIQFSKKNNSKCFLIFYFLSLFTSLPNVLQLPYYLIISFFQWRKNKANRTLKTLYIGTAFISALFFVWILSYMQIGSGTLAIQNFVDFRNKNLTDTLSISAQNILFFRQKSGISHNRHIVLFRFEFIVNYLGYISSITILLFAIKSIIKNLPSLIKFTTRINAKRILQKSIFEINLGLFFLISLFTALIFSYLYFNILDIKLLLPILIPSVFFLMKGLRCFAYITSAPFGAKFKFITLNTLIAALFILLTFLDINYLLQQRYKFKPIFHLILQKEKSYTGCINILVIHSIAGNLIDFYSLQQKQPLLNSYIYKLNYNSDELMGKFNAELEGILSNEQKQCGKLYILSYYDFLDKQSESVILLNKLLSKYIETDRIIEDNCCLKIVQYIRRE